MEVEMKMVRSLLLGSAAGLVAVAGAQAADMPVKGAAVQYVKICNLYGDGYYYLPGTDICVKVGGYVRAEMAAFAGSGATAGPFQPSANAALAVNTNNFFSERTSGQDFMYRNRTYISMDTRQMTEYGVLRTYVLVGTNSDSTLAPSTFNSNRHFIQFAGFTFGVAQSFYDIYAAAVDKYAGRVPASDTGDGGYRVFAYTQQWGNGITSSISIEEPRRVGIINANLGTPGAAVDPFVVGNNANTSAGADNAKVRIPDIVSNYRIDQGWGYLAASFAAHDASAGYYFQNSTQFGYGCRLPECR
jgi:porin-like protein